MSKLPLDTRIVSAFPGTGKSMLAQQNYAFVDVDFPEYKSDMEPYLEQIREALKIPGVIALVPTWPQLRKALQDAGMKYAIFYPKRDLKFDYNKRYVDRGSPKAFVDNMWWKWDEYLSSCEQDPADISMCMAQSQARLSDYFL
ncbi:hypothetical protein D3C80_283450 [compost metagenome]